METMGEGKARTVSGEIGRFTPVFDSVAAHERLGYIGALVFGRVWRYCQMELGKCTASQGTIAKELHLSDRTVRIYLGALVKEGYLAAVAIPGRVTEYFDTGKVRLLITAVAEEFTTPEVDSGVSANPGIRFLPPRQEIPRTPESDSDKETLKETIKRQGQNRASVHEISISPSDRRALLERVREHFYMGPTRNSEHDDQWLAVNAWLKRSAPMPACLPEILAEVHGED
jgi:hypothetical protein